MQKLIIVTGGAGLIGSGVIRDLNDQGIDRIVVVERLDSSGNWRNLVGKRFEEIVDADQIFDWLDGRQSDVGAFIHLGACSSTVEMDAGYLLNNNYRYSQRLAEYAVKHGHRFIYASSAATYGDGSLGFSDDHDLLDELRPLNPYGYSKHLFDLWAKRQGLLNQIVGLKYFNVYGPNEYHKGRMRSAVLKMVPQILTQGKVELFKSTDPEHFPDGHQRRDFIYVKDAARMTCDFLRNDRAGIFNVGTGHGTSWVTLANAVFTGLNKPKNIEFVPIPDDLRDKYQNYTCADMRKWRDLNPYTTDLDTAVIDYVRNYIVQDRTW